MARTEHGTNLISELVEQPGAVFTITKSGFDTGNRKFTCDKTRVVDFAPARGSADSTYPEMYVEDVTITEGRAGLAMIDVSYKGKIVPEESGGTEDTSADSIEYYANAQLDRIAFVYGAVDMYFTKYEPVVTHTYATSTFPDWAVGEYREPPQYADKVPASTIIVPTGQDGAGTWIFTYNVAGWRLENRQVKSVGMSYEITDTYTYRYKAVSVLAPDGSTSTFSPAL